MSPRLGDLRSYDQLLDLLADELLREIIADSKPTPRSDLADEGTSEHSAEAHCCPGNRPDVE